jgi:hypothetical protein
MNKYFTYENCLCVMYPLLYHKHTSIVHIYLKWDPCGFKIADLGYRGGGVGDKE